MTEPIGVRWVSCSRQAGSAGEYSIRPASSGGAVTMICRPSNCPAAVVAVTLLPLASILTTGAESRTMPPSAAASRSAIRAEPPTNRSCCAPPVVSMSRWKEPPECE